MRVIRIVMVAALLALAVLTSSSSGVLAYGHADLPLAQIAVSANCNNPDFPLCAPPPAGFGLGGIWLWIEIDSGGSGDVAGAGCGHIRGVGGGADPIRGDITWWSSTGPQGFNFFAIDPNNLYYNVSLGNGGPPFSFPQTQGHYSFKPAPGVSVQVQIAP